MSTQKDSSNRPVHTIRHGRIKASIWVNPTERGPMHNVTIARGYRDDEGNWHDSGSFGWDDLLVVSKAAEDAFAWISTQRAQNGSTDQEDTKGQSKKVASRSSGPE